MSEQQILWLVGMVVGAFICGLVVLMLNSSYRFEQNLESNKQYYSSIKVEPPSE